MSQTYTPVSQPSGAAVFSYNTDAERAAYLKQIGAVNADPPLPHSPCLRNKKTGMVLPWNDVFAEQRDIMECCDESGNTDPSAWAHRVIDDAEDFDVDAARVKHLKVQEQLFDLTHGDTTKHRIPGVRDTTDTEPQGLPDGVMYFDDISPEFVEQLREKLASI